jgi:hypothetical protein
MTWKDYAVEAAKEYGEYYKGREHCFHPWKWIPETFVLSNSTDCENVVKTL